MAGVIDYSSTAGSNTTIGAGALDIAEGCDAANINDAIRLLMKDIRDGSDDGNIMGSGYLTKSGAYTVLNADRGKTIDCTAALTLTLTAAATVGAGWVFFVKANGGAVTIDPNASETIDGATTLIIPDGTSAMVICDGSNFHTTMTSGQVIQVVNTETGALGSGSGTFPFDDTIPQSSEGNEFMTLAIVPTSTASKLKIEVVVQLSSANASALTAALFQDSTANALAAQSLYQATATGAVTISFTHYMTAGTTSSTTFKVRGGGSAGAGATTFNGQAGARVFGGVMSSSITITELKA